MEFENTIVIEKIKKAILESKESFKDIEAIGLFGSLVRGSFSIKSDIDVFIVISNNLSERESWVNWNKKLRNILKDFQRDITVLIYSIKSIKEISSWYVLRLASEGQLIYDPKGKIDRLFKDIIEAAKKSGLIEAEVQGYRYWMIKDLKIGETFEIKIRQ